MKPITWSDVGTSGSFGISLINLTDTERRATITFAQVLQDARRSGSNSITIDIPRADLQRYLSPRQMVGYMAGDLTKEYYASRNAYVYRDAAGNMWDEQGEPISFAALCIEEPTVKPKAPDDADRFQGLDLDND